MNHILYEYIWIAIQVYLKICEDEAEYFVYKIDQDHTVLSLYTHSLGWYKYMEYVRWIFDVGSILSFEIWFRNQIPESDFGTVKTLRHRLRNLSRARYPGPDIRRDPPKCLRNSRDLGVIPTMWLAQTDPHLIRAELWKSNSNSLLKLKSLGR